MNEPKLTILEDLCRVLKLKYPGSLSQDEIARLTRKAAGCEIAKWDLLRARTQEWVNENIAVLRTNQAGGPRRLCVEPDDYDPNYVPKKFDIQRSEKSVGSTRKQTSGGRAAKGATDGTGATRGRGGKVGGSGKKSAKTKAAGKTTAKQSDIATQRRKRSRGLGAVIVEQAIRHSIDDWGTLQARMAMMGFEVSKSALQTAIYHVRHVSSALRVMGVDVPETLEPFLEKADTDSGPGGITPA